MAREVPPMSPSGSSLLELTFHGTKLTRANGQLLWGVHPMEKTGATQMWRRGIPLRWAGWIPPNPCASVESQTGI